MPVWKSKLIDCGVYDVVVLGVVFRWDGEALSWYDEVASVQLAWLTYYGASLAALKRAHENGTYASWSERAGPAPD